MEARIWHPPSLRKIGEKKPKNKKQGIENQHEEGRFGDRKVWIPHQNHQETARFFAGSASRVAGGVIATWIRIGVVDLAMDLEGQGAGLRAERGDGDGAPALGPPRNSSGMAPVLIHPVWMNAWVDVVTFYHPSFTTFRSLRPWREATPMAAPLLDVRQTSQIATNLLT